MKKQIALFIALICVFAGSLSAQIKTPALSPLTKITQEVGVSSIEIEYSRPSARGRKVFGEVVAFGEMWRVGANASTKIKFADDVTIAGKPLPAGIYALYTIPNPTTWTIIFHKNTSHWGTGGNNFDPEEDALRVDLPVQTLGQKVETLTLSVNDIANAAYSLDLTWENVRISIPVGLNTDDKVMSSINTTLAGPGAQDYYRAATYYLNQGKDLNQALSWVNLAMEKGGEKFWMLRQKALILAGLNRFDEAIKAAERSTDVAKAEANADYPRMNEKSIQEWSAKKKK